MPFKVQCTVQDNTDDLQTPRFRYNGSVDGDVTVRFSASIWTAVENIRFRGRDLEANIFCPYIDSFHRFLKPSVQPLGFSTSRHQ